MSTKVPRSAFDATRFTSTNPHATSKPFPFPSSTSSSTPSPSTRFPQNVASPPNKPSGPKGETPQEKVKRLRAALDKARAAQVTPLERMILRGRAWADRAHRVTAWGLMGFTILAGVVTTYALFDMAIHNRRKKHEYFMEKKAAYAAALIVSRRAIEAGTANQAQIDLVEYDDAEEERQQKGKQEKEAKKGRWWRRTKEVLFSGLNKEEEHDAALNKLLGRAEEDGGMSGKEEHDEGGFDAVGGKSLDLKEKARQVFAEEKEKQRQGGPLDRLGSQTESRGSTKGDESKGFWSSFVPKR